jgi:hypothetical protein
MAELPAFNIFVHWSRNNHHRSTCVLRSLGICMFRVVTRPYVIRVYANYMQADEDVFPYKFGV